MRFYENGYCIDCDNCACCCDCEYEDTTEFKELSAEDRERIFKKLCQEREERLIFLKEKIEKEQKEKTEREIKKSQDRERIGAAAELLNRIKLIEIDLDIEELEDK